jgi:hypothetical protein
MATPYEAIPYMKTIDRLGTDALQFCDG